MNTNEYYKEQDRLIKKEAKLRVDCTVARGKLEAHLRRVKTKNGVIVSIDGERVEE